jgi:hypothetical protein
MLVLALLVAIGPPVVPSGPAPESAPAGAEARATEEPLKPQRLALYDIEVEGVEPRYGKVVTDALASELRKLEKTSVVAMDEVRAMLDHEAQKQLLGCSDESCLAEIADSLGVDGLVIGKLLKIGDQHVMAVKRIDQRNAQATGFSQNLTPADGEEFLAVVGPCVEQLFPEVPLRPGAVRGVSPELAVRLNPPPFDPWVFWSTLGSTGAAALVTAGAASLNAVELARHEELRQQGSIRFAELKASADRADLYAFATWVGLGVVALGAGGTIMSVPLTDWNGARGDP